MKTQHLTLLCLALCLWLQSCSGSGKKKIVVYSTHGKEMLTHFEKAFEEKHPDLDVQWLDMGSQNALDRVRTERENPQADLWWGGPKELFEQAESENLLSAYKPSWAKAVAPAFKSKQDAWYASFITPEVIMYNSALVKGEDAPQDWDELLGEKWRQKIIIRNPLQSGTMRTIFAAMIAKEMKRTLSLDSGYAWLRQLHRNTKGYAVDPTQLYLKLQRGEATVTLWNLTDVLIQSQTNHLPFGYVLPKSGTVSVIEGIALIHNAKHLEDATLFYEFITSAESLKVQAEKFYRLPSRADVKVSVDWFDAKRLVQLDIDEDLAAKEQSVWLSYWQTHIRSQE